MVMDGNSGDKEDMPADVDINMLFELPGEFRAPKAEAVEVVELVLGPKSVTFERP